MTVQHGTFGVADSPVAIKGAQVRTRNKITTRNDEQVQVRHSKCSQARLAPCLVNRADRLSIEKQENLLGQQIHKR